MSRHLPALLLLGFITLAGSSQYFSSVNMEPILDNINYVLGPDFQPNDPEAPIIGGYGCAICTVFVLQIERFVVTNDRYIDDFISNDLCELFPGHLKDFCQSVVGKYGQSLIHALYENASPDVACQQLKACNASTQSGCRLVQNHQMPNITFSPSFVAQATHIRVLDQTDLDDFNIHMNPLVKNLTDWLFSYTHTHEPDIDNDKDHFSEVMAQARGYNWRGRDCNDNNNEIYPGRSVNPGSSDIDYNCNGIYGYDMGQKQSWKDTLCSDSNQLGFAVIGDSVGAHFQIPPQWANGSAWNKTTFNNFFPSLFDEFDLPMLSGWSGYFVDTPERPSRSLYQYMLQLNKCNHRDYQNLGVNGATSYTVWDPLLTFARNASTDIPVFVVLELVGNDVCGGGEDMTEPDDFYDNILKILDYLNTKLPPGSHVISVGLVDGRVLYQIMANRTHPSGVTYTDFYNFLNCLHSSPCTGWMNSNDTFTNYTYSRVVELNAEYEKIINNGFTWSNFDYDYYDFPSVPIINKWVEEGNDPALLIEPVDGFHPSQIMHALIADWFWEELEADHSDWFGPANPNNEKIQEMFGDQGGY